MSTIPAFFRRAAARAQALLDARVRERSAEIAREQTGWTTAPAMMRPDELLGTALRDALPALAPEDMEEAARRHDAHFAGQCVTTEDVIAGLFMLAAPEA